MIGQRVKIARSAAGLSLRDLESKIDNLVTAQAISKYERNESMPSSRVLIALADALGVSAGIPDQRPGYQTRGHRVSKEKTRHQAAKKPKSKHECWTCWRDTSRWRKFLRCRAWTGTNLGRLPGRSGRMLRKRNTRRMDCAHIGGLAPIPFQTWRNYWRNAASRSFRWMLIKSTD